MNLEELLSQYSNDPKTELILNRLENIEGNRIHLKGLVGSSSALLASSIFMETPLVQLFILADKEAAAYFYNDLENIFNEQSLDYNKKKILFYPTAYKRPYEIEKTDNANILLRSEVLSRINSTSKRVLIVTYPEALSEKVITKKYLNKNTISLKTGEEVSLDFITDLLIEYEFERVEFVVEPGRFSVRGGIIDVFSYSNDYPFRLEFYGDIVESIRSFDPATQLSNDKLSRVSIVPNVLDRTLKEVRESFLSFIPKNTIVWIKDVKFSSDIIFKEFEKAERTFAELSGEVKHLKPKDLFLSGEEFVEMLGKFSVVEFGKQFYFEAVDTLYYDIKPQPSFNKNFDLLIKNLNENSKDGIKNVITTDQPKQVERIYSIFEDIQKVSVTTKEVDFSTINISLQEGFIDKQLKIACYTDHQIFDRYHRFFLRDRFKSKEAITIKEIYDLKPGDYITHIDHGIGKFHGLEKIDINGKEQEAIRLIYKDNDILYISIHSLHRITKYVGKEGTPPSLHRLGTNTWKKLKSKTKQKVKDIAKDLIKLYAERKSTKGFAFSQDSYLQHELEASFIYEDTPDQYKSTLDVKRDLEADYPMDRLVCGDVGFGKTEVAIRAAFKVVADSKQVALLVPTTILALQHYNTFTNRLKDFPCNVEYINRFKTTKQQTIIKKGIEQGTIDILIGTHRLVGKDIKFKDLGLLIIDEEQKFGVGVKEKLRKFKVNVDTLTLTATPIPRTLQFSLMGARDMSIINTAPPNRHPIQTEIHLFNEDVIRNAIIYEISRSGQVFFVHNRVQNILEVAGMLQRIVPDIKIAVAHGQMEGRKLEKVMLDFIDGYYDVLVATTIIESGLDIPNVNTIIINEAQNYGLSDLHQLRGRVGRANRKAFCYLLSPPLSVLTSEARKRLQAIEEFSDLGSGFNIAMRDLDLRGAGNILGGEQSGFIADIGFEMYHKILNEAVQELKENEFKDIYKENIQGQYVKDCQIETDLAILIPDDYISNITERLSLYKELDNIDNENDLLEFEKRLIDRFGPVPQQTKELLSTIRFRWLAKRTGFEKVVLKNNRFIGYFISNQESSYYQSPQFSKVLNYIQANPTSCTMRESKNKLSIIFNNISSIYSAINVLLPMEWKELEE